MTPQEELRDIFFESAAELLQQLNDHALHLEANPQDAETVRAIRRTVHTLKGDSAVLGFRELSELAHELEDVLTPESAASHGARLAEVVLSAADMFDAMVAAYEGGIQPPTGDPLRAMIAKIRRGTRESQGGAGLTSNAASRKPSPGSAPRLRTVDENVLRIDAAKIDTLLDLIGEMVIGRSMLQQAVTEFGQRYPKDAMRTRLGDALSLQTQTLRALQRAAMAVRMVPADQLFRRFPRLVRDVARQCGKQVTLETSGAETELDKTLVDALAEPLGHIVRNAIDHGIEGPEQRRAAGKPEASVLRIHAFHEANQMVIEIHDDGRGIDRENIVRRAIERGLVTAEDAGTLDGHEITELIFEPGFSTANEITPVSGRGVGLDVVQAAVRKLKGTVAVESTAGKGTTIRLRMPLTLAIVRSMLFRVGNSLYAVPLDIVVEIRRANEHEFTRAGNREVMQIRDELVTVIRIPRTRGGAADPSEKMFIIVLSVGARKYGLAVDAPAGEQELVIKPVEEKTIASPLVSGASVLGDGTVALVLNVEEAVRRYAFATPVTGLGTWDASNSAIGTLG